MDQAERLRSLVNKRMDQVTQLGKGMRVIAITSGKGGVGKTNFAINLSIYLSRAGKRVILIDADFGLANVEVLFGVSPRYSFREVLSGEVTVADALTMGPDGVRFLSGGSGFTQMANITESHLAALLSGFSQLEDLTDILIIDTGAGVSKAVTNLLKAAGEIIVVTTSDPTAIADAYAVMKAIAEEDTDPPVTKIVVNRVESSKEGLEVYKRLYRVCSRFLNIKPINLGNIPYDRHLVRSVKSQEPVALMYPNSESSRSIQIICKKLLDENVAESTGIRQFIDRWVRFMKK